MLVCGVLLLLGAVTGFGWIFVLAVVSCIITGTVNAYITLRTRKQ